VARYVVKEYPWYQIVEFLLRKIRIFSFVGFWTGLWTSRSVFNNNNNNNLYLEVLLLEVLLISNNNNTWSCFFVFVFNVFNHSSSSLDEVLKTTKLPIWNFNRFWITRITGTTRYALCRFWATSRIKERKQRIMQLWNQ